MLWPQQTNVTLRSQTPRLARRSAFEYLVTLFGLDPFCWAAPGRPLAFRLPSPQRGNISRLAFYPPITDSKLTTPIAQTASRADPLSLLCGTKP
jgi:hypothetical protein